MANRIANSTDAATWECVNVGDYLIDSPGAGDGLFIDNNIQLDVGKKICIAGNDIVPHWSHISINMPQTLVYTELRRAICSHRAV